MTEAFAGYRAAFVRIYGVGRVAVGGGCLVGDRHVVTCAHVVSDALGGSARDADPPSGSVDVDFPLLAGQPVQRAAVVHWVPILGDEQGDLAVLALSELAPSSARPAPLVAGEDLWDHPFRAYGFPAGAAGGEYASGRLLAAQATGWVQLEGVGAQGGRIERGYSGAPVWDERLGGVVGIVVAAKKQAEAKVGYLIPTSELVRACGDFLPREPAALCPYQGLSAFREQQAGVFFGRDQAVAQLIDAVGHRSLVAVLGASGSGKSSVVFAGLLPALRDTRGWRFADFRPGRRPFDSLAGALVPLLRPELESSTNVLDRLQATPEVAAVLASFGLPAVLRQLTSTGDGRRLLVVVDQFEELFTLCPDLEARQAFLDAVLEAVRDAEADVEPPVVFVVTLRADFLGQALAHRPLADALHGADVKLGPMTAPELQAAVERPAATSGVRFEGGLVARILGDLRNEPGHLPLLEFALTLLWDHQRDRTLTHEGYEAVGGVARALAHHADAVYLSLSPTDQERARRVFVQLVKPGEGTEDTRRLATAADLSAEDWALLRRLATKRLAVTDRDPAGEDTAEVAHEALIRGWGRLREWLTADREFRIWQERLRDALRLWVAHAEDDAVLLRGLLLVEAEEWLAHRPEEVGAAEQRFLARSRQRQNEQEAQYRALYEAAIARQLAAQAELLRGGDPVSAQRGVLLAEEALRRDASFDTDFALRRAIAGLGRTEAEDLAVPVAAPAAGPRVLVGDDVVRVCDEDGAELAAVPYQGWIHATALSPDGRLLAVAGDDGSARVWEVAGGEVGRFPHGGLVNAVAFGPGGRLLATGGDDGAVRVWEVGGGEVGRFPHDGLVSAVAFSPEGARLATAGQDGQARVWDVRRQTELQRLPAVGEVARVGFTGDGSWLLCGDPPQRRWPLRQDELLRKARALAGRRLSPEEWAQYLGDEPYPAGFSGPA